MGPHGPGSMKDCTVHPTRPHRLVCGSCHSEATPASASARLSFALPSRRSTAPLWRRPSRAHVQREEPLVERLEPSPIHRRCRDGGRLAPGASARSRAGSHVSPAPRRLSLHRPAPRPVWPGRPAPRPAARPSVLRLEFGFEAASEPRQLPVGQVRDQGLRPAGRQPQGLDEQRPGGIGTLQVPAGLGHPQQRLRDAPPRRNGTHGVGSASPVAGAQVQRCRVYLLLFDPPRQGPGEFRQPAGPARPGRPPSP